MFDLEIENSWNLQLGAEISKPYFIKLQQFLNSEYSNFTVYPPKGQIFKAFNQSAFDRTKVIIVGQDPYHGFGQANGMCFSVSDGILVPPSLKNIFKELKLDIGKEIPTSGNLDYWAHQGVLLLNSILTVRANEAGSHQNKGWEFFTDAVIKKLSENKVHLVFILWGAYAQKKGALIDRKKHYVLESVHPSPLSASRGFFGNHHFSKANSFLKEKGIDPISW